MVVCIITPGVKYAWSRGPCFLVTAQSAPHPRGHTPISQNGSIAPVYILLWTNDSLITQYEETMQDFASYRASADLEASRAYSAAWSPDTPSLIFGVLLGVAVCLVGLKAVQTTAEQAVFIEAPIIIEEVVEKPLEFDFYEALQSYVVLPRTYD